MSPRYLGINCACSYCIGIRTGLPHNTDSQRTFSNSKILLNVVAQILKEDRNLGSLIFSGGFQENRYFPISTATPLV
uniref:Uncharacterized protein n=1 Tax=Anguilla anguilla TaxID=7936 RepID=A0A0E9XBV4_ANGAN